MTFEAGHCKMPGVGEGTGPFSALRTPTPSPLVRVPGVQVCAMCGRRQVRRGGGTWIRLFVCRECWCPGRQVRLQPPIVMTTDIPQPRPPALPHSPPFPRTHTLSRADGRRGAVEAQHTRGGADHLPWPGSRGSAAGASHTKSSGSLARSSTSRVVGTLLDGPPHPSPPPHPRHSSCRPFGGGEPMLWGWWWR